LDKWFQETKESKYKKFEIEEVELYTGFEAHQCGTCLEVLQSKWSGHFDSCFCGDSFVDQTYHYSRYGGNVEPLRKETE